MAHNEIAVLPGLDPEHEALWKKSQLKVLDLESNSVYEVPPVIFKNSRIHNFNLKDNHIKRNQLMNMDGINDYQARRKLKMDIVVNNNLDVNFDLCGLDS